MKTSVLRVLAVIVFAIVFCFPVLSQDTAEAYYDQSLVLKKKGKYDEAIRLLDQAIRLNSNYIDALFLRSEAKQNNQRDLDGALVDLETILQLDPASGRAYFERARLRNALMLKRLKKQGHTRKSEMMPYYQEILDDVNAAIENGYKNKDTYTYRANLSLYFDRHKDSIEDYSKAISYEPKDTGLFLNRSYVKRQAGDLKGAAEDLQAIVNIYEEALAAENPDKKEIERLKGMAIMSLNNLTSIFALLEDPDLQLWAIGESLKLEPNADAYAARGRHHMIFGVLSTAIEDYTTAIEMASRDSSKAMFLMNRGIVYLLIGDQEKAEADFDEGRKNPGVEDYSVKYWLELSKRQREQRRIKVKLPN